MTRRDLLRNAAFAAAQAPLAVPVHRVMDRRASCTAEELRRFWFSVWPEAVRMFGRAGVALHSTDAQGEIRRSPGGRPVFTALERGAINLVLTASVPMHWDQGRSLAGVTTLHEGYCICLLALQHAHGNRVPFLSVNTCVHELLHALLGDVFVRRPGWFRSRDRESRVNWHATRLWLFHDGAAVQQSAREFLNRLSEPPTRAARPNA
jgi:hypothetical protein